MYVLSSISAGRCSSHASVSPSCYLGHSRVQVVHDHVHDGRSSSRPTGVLLDGVGPARGVQPPGVMMGGPRLPAC